MLKKAPFLHFLLIFVLASLACFISAALIHHQIINSFGGKLFLIQEWELLIVAGGYFLAFPLLYYLACRLQRMYSGPHRK